MVVRTRMMRVSTRAGGTWPREAPSRWLGAEDSLRAHILSACRRGVPHMGSGHNSTYIGRVVPRFLLTCRFGAVAELYLIR